MDDIEEKEVNLLVNNINTDITKSQYERMYAEVKLKENLIGFIQNRIDIVQQGSALKKLVNTKLITELNQPDTPLGALIKIYEILSKNENDVTASIFDILKSNPMKADSGLIPTEEEESSMTKKEMQELKELASFMNKIKNSEFKLEEE